MKAEPTFTPVILDLQTPIVFDQEIDFRGVNERKPATDMLSNPWYAYSQRTMSAFYAHGVQDDMTTFFARALEEAYQMGQHGIVPLPAPAGKRNTPSYAIHGAVAPKVVQHHFDPRAGSKVRQESATPTEAEETLVKATTPRSTPVDRSKEPNRASVHRLIRKVEAAKPVARIIRRK